MLNLLENCSCPQKTVYVVIAGTTLVNLLGLYSGASKVGAVTKNFAVKFIISVLVVILIFKVLEWMCTKNTTGWNTLAWVIALLPLV
jgi:di/tricarboxylate transporter